MDPLTLSPPRPGVRHVNTDAPGPFETLARVLNVDGILAALRGGGGKDAGEVEAAEVASGPVTPHSPPALQPGVQVSGN